MKPRLINEEDFIDELTVKQLERAAKRLNGMAVPMRTPKQVVGDLSAMELQVALDEANLSIAHLRAIALPNSGTWNAEAEAIQKGLRAIERCRDLLDRLMTKQGSD